MIIVYQLVSKGVGHFLVRLPAQQPVLFFNFSDALVEGGHDVGGPVLGHLVV